MGQLLEKIELLDQVAELMPKGYNEREIARALDIPLNQAKMLVKEYHEAISKRVMDDPDFLDRLQENTMAALEGMDMIIRETWEAYDSAKAMDMIPQMTNLLKLAGDLAEKRAKLLQLMGAKVDSGFMARMNRLEQVNDIVSRVLKETIAHCDKCRMEAQVRLAEAFQIMNRADEVVDMEPIEDDTVDAEIIDEQEEQEADDAHAAMMLDVISDE
jgi:transcription elongation factor Elf1